MSDERAKPSVALEPLAVFEGANLYYVHPDNLDRPVMMTNNNAAQTIAWAARYDPFGNAITVTSAITNNQRLAGQWFQIEDGLSYNWHRTYDPTLGRYTQADPLGFVDGPSVYGYGGGSPLMRVDPWGYQTVPPSIPGGPWTPAGPGQKPFTFFGPKQPNGPRAMCQYVPPEGQGGPPGSKSYWKYTPPGGKEQRYSPAGEPITAEEAHPNPLPGRLLRPLIPLIITPIPPNFFCTIDLTSPSCTRT